MHRLLARQLRRHGINAADLPAQYVALLDEIGATYDGSDTDRALLERSLELTSQELTQRFSAIRLKQDELQTILDSVPALIWYKDTRNRILRANKAAGAALGRAPKDLEGQDMYDLLPQQAEGYYKDDLEVILTEKPKIGIVEELPFANGEKHWLSTDKVPFRDAKGRVAGVIVFCVDITAGRLAEQNLQKAYKELEELVKFRTQFLNTTAHELRTPLTPIILQSHLLRDALSPLSDPQQQKGFEILDRNIRRLDSLVRDVLDAARLQSGRLPLRTTDLELGQVVTDAVETVAPQAEQQEITLEFRADKPIPIVGDVIRLTQVMSNLLANALKFTPPQGKITVTAVQSGDRALVSVQDTGIGVNPKDISRLFQPFSQVHDPMQTTAPGTGLGLYVSRGIVEQHGGKIWCYSAGLNGGSTFSFWLPLANVEAPSSPRSFEATPRPSTPTTTLRRPSAGS